MDATAPRSTCAGEGRRAAEIVVHVLVQICTEALGGLVSAVGRWAEGHGLGGTEETIAHGVDLRRSV